MDKLFGTDGIRGKANRYPMTSEISLNIGRSASCFFNKNKKIIIGKDTRLSCDMIESALISGICSMGVDVYLAGVIPTPGISFLTYFMNMDAGIMISASHNPFYDNGIKFFKGDGYKLNDNEEAEIEKIFKENNFKYSQDIGRVYSLNDSDKNYVNFLKDRVRKDISFKGIKLVIDCANGATFRAAKEVFSSLEIDVYAISVSPNGKNINDNCGSEHPKKLSEAVLEKQADIGLAFDGDGDRVIAVDEKGKILSGDQIIAICAKHLKQNGRLKNNTVVTTVMSNMGLSVALKDMDIKHAIANVGDRYVLEMMKSCGAIIGGEDSGHMIFLDYHRTGDGILSALQLMESIVSSQKPLSELGKIMSVFPQMLVNVEVKNKPDIETVPEIYNVIKKVEKELAGKGRVLVRYSGTQPLCRVMVEAPTNEDTKRYCDEITKVIKSHKSFIF
ncbi:MAG: phosphoglucosamine mutase [Desulfobacterales bacterium]|nr:phosphoglucosamine mutase [Desulfobacterales bacterium]